MTKETFAKGLQLLNAVLTKTAQITANETITIYWHSLEDLDDRDYIEGITFLVKNLDNPHFTPGPGAIKKAAEQYMYSGLSAEEIDLVKKVYAQHKFHPSDSRIAELLEEPIVDDVKKLN